MLVSLTIQPQAKEAPARDKADGGNQHHQSAPNTPHDRAQPRMGVLTPDEVRAFDKEVHTAIKPSERWSKYFYGYFQDLKITDILLAGFTAALVYYTRGLDRSTGRLWEESKAQRALSEKVAADQARDMKASINHAQTAAEAAKKSADALTIVERAYVYPTVEDDSFIEDHIRGALVHFLDDDQIDTPIQSKINIMFNITNYGKTPAVLKTIYAGVGINGVATEYGFSISKSVLGAEDSSIGYLVNTESGITRRHAMNIGVYQAAFMFTGTIVFEDVWGIEHQTSFAFAWDKDIKRLALRGMKTESRQPDRHDTA